MCIFYLTQPSAEGGFWYVYHALRGAGVAGVSMFFALSGFILAYSYEGLQPNKPSLIKFYISRFSRIYPVYLLGIVLFAPFILLHRFMVEPVSTAVMKSVAAFVPSVLLTQAWFHPHFATSWNGPGWSLSVEAVFYMAFPFLVPRIRALGQSGRLAVAAVAILASLCLSYFVPLLLPGWKYTEELVRFNPFFQLPTFIFGVAVGLFYTGMPAGQRVGRLVAPAAMVSILLLGMASLHVPGLVVHNTVFLPLFGMLFIGLAGGGVGSRFLSTPGMRLLGESSFSLYILQFAIALAVVFALDGFAIKDQYGSIGQIPERGYLVYMLILSVSVAVSVLVFRSVESPLRTRLKASLSARLLPAKPDSSATAHDLDAMAPPRSAA